MQEPRQRTSEELQELRREGLAAQSPVATRLVVVAGVLICSVIVLRNTRFDATSAFGLHSLLVLLGTLICTSAAVTLCLGLLSPLVQRKGLVKVGLVTPRLRPFPDRMPFTQLLLGFLVALVVALYLGYRFAGAILSLGFIAISLPFKQLAGLFESEALWLAGVSTIIALIAAFAAQYRFARGG